MAVQWWISLYGCKSGKACSKLYEYIELVPKTEVLEQPLLKKNKQFYNITDIN
ncbi:hypothetical protein Holit_00077 [Hollandina sp. SP2]